MDSPQPSPLLSLRDVAVTYPGGHAALLPTQLDLRAGSFVVLLGASGAGKSTLLRCLNGLVQPTAGSVSVSDLPGSLLNGRSLREHRRRCGMVFQQHHLIGRLSVLDNVLMGRLGAQSAWASCWPWRRADKQQALAAIERVGLLDKALARADTLSGGQQQRVGVARALVQRPRLLLADEPVASLDPATARGVLRLLHDICRHDPLTAVVSLHQVELALEFADRIVGLRQGRVVFDGPPDQLTPAAQARLYSASVPHATSAEAPGPLAPTLALSTQGLQAC